MKIVIDTDEQKITLDDGTFYPLSDRPGRVWLMLSNIEYILFRHYGISMKDTRYHGRDTLRVPGEQI